MRTVSKIILISVFLFVLAGSGYLVSHVFEDIPNSVLQTTRKIEQIFSALPQPTQKVFPSTMVKTQQATSTETITSASSTTTAATSSAKKIVKKPSLVEPKKVLHSIAPPKIQAVESSAPQPNISVQSTPDPIRLPVQTPTSSVPAPTPAATPTPSQTPLSPVGTDSLFRAVVKLECLTANGTKKIIGSGYVTNNRTVVTAAHILMNAGATCTVFFPQDRKPIYSVTANLTDPASVVAIRHDEKGIDYAMLTLPVFEEGSQAAQIFGSSYPSILYPTCTDTNFLGDTVMQFGYPSNYASHGYLDEVEGQIVTLADINGIETLLSEDGTYTFKSPIFLTSEDETVMHPYVASQAPTFYGDSGGLVFDKTKQCVIGPIRGGTIGGGPGENYSVFFNMGWNK